METEAIEINGQNERFQIEKQGLKRQLLQLSNNIQQRINTQDELQRLHQELAKKQNVEKRLSESELELTQLGTQKATIEEKKKKFWDDLRVGAKD